ncbi:Predicted membrane protein [Asanoa hainanensis]|uniref:Predicted membrane protein n=1 Tax=Asanoa hainanensis TaxID=560556 RepID=A0A239GL29_9ACTN|nr:DUF2207 domain-containing protein [Asanoa hainanensis]SNS69512.1 Predicted membrane protein [Asanoa hainanensis]
MTTVDLLIEVGLPAACFVLFICVNLAARRHNRPRPVTPGPASTDLPGSESPAVVSLLVNDWQVTADAAGSTVFDLAARGYLDLRHDGPDPRHTTASLTGRDPLELNRYERLVLDRVADRARGGAVPLLALAFNDGGRYADWWRRLTRHVVEEARALGLTRPRFSLRMVAALRVLTLLVAAGIAWGVIHAVARVDAGELSRDEQYAAGAGLCVVVFGFLSIFGRYREGQRETAAGRAAAARWLGLRAALAGDESFAELPPTAVSTWGRQVAYGTALGVSRLAPWVVDLGMTYDRRIWSSYTGAWRQVRVRYPVRASAAPQSWNPLRARPTAPPATVTGEVIWCALNRTTDLDYADYPARGDDSQPVTYHLVVDDGSGDEAEAWILLEELAGSFQVGDVVTVEVQPLSRKVLGIGVVRAAPGDPYVDEPGSLPKPAERESARRAAEAAAMTRQVRPEHLLTVAEVGHALGRRVILSRNRLSAGSAARTAEYVDSGTGRALLTVMVLAGAPAVVAGGVSRALDRPLPVAGGRAYAGRNRLVAHHDGVTVSLTVADGDPALLSDLLATAVRRIEATGDAGSPPWLRGAAADDQVRG